MHMAI